jgi:type 2 lantibiotic biosynthesis protein LanM
VTDFTAALGCLVEPAADALGERLRVLRGLGADERAALRKGAAAALYETAHRKACRMLVLELNAARESGQLTAGDSAARWDEFIALASQRTYWESLAVHYPTMLARLDRVLANRCEAAAALAGRLAADRHSLGELTGTELGELTAVSLGAGDSHRGGHTVALLTFEGGSAVYKPRPVRVDQALDGFLGELFPDGARIRVPAVVVGDGYGWAEYAAHEYCDGDGQLSAFYRGIGHWLAVMRLLGGSDLHAENVIACGPVPVVVDCETLFTPLFPAPPSGIGLAVDRAADLVEATVLRTGILPNRGIALGWRGVDSSAVGSLPGEQPANERPVLLDGGTDRARIGFEPAPGGGVAASHPSPDPSLAAYWDRILAGFDEASDALRRLDRDGALAPLLARFADTPVRVVLRGTEAYAELGRMLWHPVSLHDPDTAVERAEGLLARMAASVPGAPGDPAVIAAEVAELLDGDVPYFAALPAEGRLTGPAGLTLLEPQDLVADALARWRAADLDLDRRVIRATLVTAYLNEGWTPGGAPMESGPPRADGLPARRRALLRALLCEVRDSALRAEDGTVTWIAPVLNLTGWAVQPLGQDLYGGLAGVAVLLAAYLRECRAGRADPVEGVGRLLDAVLRTMRGAEDFVDRGRVSDAGLRPAPPGGYLGLGSQVWAWLALAGLGAAAGDGVERARALADGLLPAAVAADEDHEVLTGAAGAIVPLLQLADATGEARWRDQAAEIGERLAAAARWEKGRACWPSPRWPRGIGGFAHGVSGIGWALARLALVAKEEVFAEAARGAFAFEEALYDEGLGGWLDLREPGQSVAAWCHGAVGIGVSAADLARHGWPVPSRVLARAAAAVERQAFGWNHTLCHGDLGAWELLDLAVAAGAGPAGLTGPLLQARVVGSLERNGAVSGMARDAFSPGLLGGVGGVAYQLLRMHTASGLPSLLTLGESAPPGYS